jgi:hypothetical protein
MCVEIHVKIPVPVNCAGSSCDQKLRFRDANGVVYQTGAIQDACEKASDIPIIRYQPDGKPDVIGVARSVEWNPDGFINVDGLLWFGGTSESGVVFDDRKNVTKMIITEIGLGT